MSKHWDALAKRHAEVKDRAILDLFEWADRAEVFAASAGEMILDYSKTNIDPETRDLLVALAKDTAVADKRAAMFGGEKINDTEGRAVLHVALRAGDDAVIYAEQCINHELCIAWQKWPVILPPDVPQLQPPQ